MAGDEDSDSPLLPELQKEPGQDERGKKRTGTLWTAIAHIITAVIGAGVLSLAWSIAQLGWVAGPVAMLLFAAVTLFQSSLLADCYRSPDPEHGEFRNHHYMDAVRHFLGERSYWVCGSIQQLCLFGAGLTYTITSATSMRAIKKSDCYHREGHSAPCSYGDTFYALLFGVVQIVFSQIPDFHEMAWLSALAAAMSFSYSTIGLGLGLAKVIGNGTVRGGIGGVSMATTSQKVWRISQALGDIAYAYPYSIILFDIERTLNSQGHSEIAAAGEPNDEESKHHLHPHHHHLLPLLRLLRLRSLRRRHSREPLDRFRLLRTILAHRLRERMHCGSLSRRLSGLQPASVLHGRQMGCREVPRQCIREQVLQPSTAAAVAARQIDSVPAVFQDSVCCSRHRACHALPLLQPGAGSHGGLLLLAYCRLLPCGDVPRAEKDQNLEQRMVAASEFQCRVLVTQRICLGWIV
ncbi:probable amino acid permease 7 isoform X2 [Zingiber officinale]|uniref:probable amino acid permease 7 isoform X2 n=1 Tax=Zingiber officinale TaxID=94328 RepID=UPI001C4CF25D|nr:probable amino acid permease 7 isoform X2 [Zingiber officinale]